MDFTFSAEADEAAGLTTRILRDATTPERQRAVEADGDRFDPALWSELGSAGLLGLAVPDEHGGAGLGLIELCRVLVEVGRRVAAVPLAVHGAAALLIAEDGTPEQRERWLPGAASGEHLLSAAVAEDLAYAPAEPSEPTVRAVDADEGWTLHGTKTLVRAGHRAAALLVTASTGEETGVFLMPSGAAGIRAEEQRTSDGDRTLRVTFDGARAERVGDAAAVQRLLELLAVTACAEQLGVTEGALALTAQYAKDREQFGRPIGIFQAVRHRLADGHIDLLGQRLTLWQAAWRLSERLPAATQVATARLWAADAGHRIAHTAIHVHGGVGIDLDGEAHRYFTAAKRWEFTTGGSTLAARDVGRLLAETRGS